VSHDGISSSCRKHQLFAHTHTHCLSDLPKVNDVVSASAFFLKIPLSFKACEFDSGYSSIPGGFPNRRQSIGVQLRTKCFCSSLSKNDRKPASEFNLKADMLWAFTAFLRLYRSWEIKDACGICCRACYRTQRYSYHTYRDDIVR
jgi:hypothetical protein